jgi:hypothetical protein
MSDDITYFAQTNFRNQLRRFGIKRIDRRRHMYLIGKTGTGKSTLMENMIVTDIRAGEGVAVVDPHGELVEKIIRFIPTERTNDVVYFNPADLEYPIAFNILECPNPEHRNLIASGLVGVFKKIWADSWGPRLEYILMNGILALLEYPGSTLLGLMRMLVDKQFRKKVITYIKDPVVKSFWMNEYANYNEKFRNEAIAPIQNKVGQFLASAVIRNIVGQTKSTIDLREVMDQKKILLLNLSKGRIGEENSALLGAMMITRIQLTAMSRVDIPEEERPDFYLYVDEFQNFSTDSFANILSEARKYRLNLIMAHQYIEQLGEVVSAAVFGNVGTIIAFRIGAADAEFLEPEFEPIFVQQDLVNLPNFNIYLKLMIDGITSQAFSAQTLPPVAGDIGNADVVISVSRERYAKRREDVEEKIARWSGVEEDVFEEGGEADRGERFEREREPRRDREGDRRPMERDRGERRDWGRREEGRREDRSPRPRSAVRASEPQRREDRRSEEQSPRREYAAQSAPSRVAEPKDRERPKEANQDHSSSPKASSDLRARRIDFLHPSLPIASSEKNVQSETMPPPHSSQDRPTEPAFTKAPVGEETAQRPVSMPATPARLSKPTVRALSPHAKKTVIDLNPGDVIKI